MDMAALLDGLQALSDSAFPKQGPSCGKVYTSVEEFTRETEDLRNGSGLQEGLGEEEDEVVVELYRNCSCGSTLMNFFSDRRDNSEHGKKRRAAFDKAYQLLLSNKIAPTEAREEIHKLMRGEPSAVLNALIGRQ